MSNTSHFLRSLAREHDDLPAFHAVYLVSVLMAAALLNGGFFGLCILAHVTLDVVKYRDVHGMSWLRTIRATVRESVMDIVLLLFVLVMAVYLHQEAAIAVAGGTVQTALIQALGMLLPEMHILGRTLRVYADVAGYLRIVPRGITKPWGGWERLLLLTVLAELALLALAPVLLGIDGGTYGDILADQLVPWRV